MHWIASLSPLVVAIVTVVGGVLHVNTRLAVIETRIEVLNDDIKQLQNRLDWGRSRNAPPA